MKREVALMLGAVAFSASAREWFDGGINRHWPDFTFGGVWTDSGGGYFSTNAVWINSELDAPAVFTAREAKVMPESAQAFGFTTEMVFGFQKELPDPSEVGKGAITVLMTGDDQYAYHVLEKDGATNRWTAVAGSPDIAKLCRVAFEFVQVGGTLRVTYKVDGVTLAVKDVSGEASLSEVCYAGEGEVVSLTGTFDTDKARFDLLTVPGCLVGSVYADGTKLVYPYEVASGSRVQVEYHAQGDTCFPNGETTVVKDCTIDSDLQVVAVPAEAMPVTAVARVKDTRFTSLASAFASAQGGDTITVLADCDGVPTLGLADRGAITLDLNGHVVGGAGVGPLLSVSGDTTLTFVNGDVTDADGLRQFDGSTLVSLNGGSVVLDGRRNGEILGDGTGAAFHCIGNGSVTINGGAVFGRLDGSGFTVNVDTNGDRFASARFSQDESGWLSSAAKARNCRMDQALDGTWSVDRLLDLGTLFFFR